MGGDILNHQATFPVVVCFFIRSQQKKKRHPEYLNGKTVPSKRRMSRSKPCKASATDIGTEVWRSSPPLPPSPPSPLENLECGRTSTVRRKSPDVTSSRSNGTSAGANVTPSRPDVDPPRLFFTPSGRPDVTSSPPNSTRSRPNVTSLSWGNEGIGAKEEMRAGEGEARGWRSPSLGEAGRKGGGRWGGEAELWWCGRGDRGGDSSRFPLVLLLLLLLCASPWYFPSLFIPCAVLRFREASKSERAKSQIGREAGR